MPLKMLGLRAIKLITEFIITSCLRYIHALEIQCCYQPLPNNQVNAIPNLPIARKQNFGI
jgi:hypothetical protein